ncbi:MAG: L-seryl-tRNA(Sec) selenium transferase [Coriobacteriia bacterium]|nr:L-seryl-tRNA(Sec) selenium transferase [Coriobacteriia bacterium]
MDVQARLRQLPKVDEALKHPRVVAMLEAAPRALVVEALREAIEASRERLLADEDARHSEELLLAEAEARLAGKTRPSLRRAINATGIVIHTNLGRSPLAPEAAEAAAEAAVGYSTLEYDAETGERGSRHVHVEELLKRASGAEAAMAVNNNAAAVLLAIAALARGKEAVVSRGQLVEIGGSFRIPDIMRESGATMVEVGTTNKTHLRDYEEALTDRTGLLLKVHSSNFRVVGFTEEVSLAELVALGAQHGVPVYEDQGSGVLVDLRGWGLPYEPTVRESVEAGADVVSCSGDKLLGGPQAGILVGKWHVIAKLKKHPLARALRLDKMTLAALEATLRTYAEPELAAVRIPTLRMLTTPVEEIRARAERLAALVAEHAPGAFAAEVVPEVSRAGGGALPMADIATHVLALRPLHGTEVEIEERLRRREVPVVVRVKEDRLLLDPRTLTEAEEREVALALAEAVPGPGG